MSGHKTPPIFDSLFLIRQFYGIAEPTLRRWRALGRKTGDPFPAENPSEVLRWYRRHFKKGTPHQLVTAVRKWERGSGKHHSRTAIQGGPVRQK